MTPSNTQLYDQINELVLDCLNTSYNGGQLSPTGQDFRNDCVDQILALFTQAQLQLLSEVIKAGAGFKSGGVPVVPVSVIENKMKGLQG